MTDVYLLIIDCLRHDMVDYEIGGQPLMPNLKRFSDSSARFRNAFASAPTTHFAVPTILTGVLPFTLHDKQGITPDVRYLPAFLSEKGFETYGYTTNAVTSHIFGYSRGFRIFHDFLDSSEISWTYRMRKKLVHFLENLPPGKRRFYDALMLPVTLFMKLTGWQLNPEMMNYKITRMMDGSNIIDALGRDLEGNGGDNRFFFLHFVDTHAPYAPPERYMEDLIPRKYRTRSYLQRFFHMVYRDEEKVLNDPVLRKRNLDLYLSACKYQDHLFGRFLEMVRDESGDTDPLILIMADHGEAFGEHGYLQHRRTKFSGPHIRIPLIVKGPGIENGEYSGLVDETDILPMILRKLGLSHGETEHDPFGKGKDMILTLGYSGTYSLTTRKVRFISDDTGRSLYSFEDVEERSPRNLNDEVSSLFERQAGVVKERARSSLDEREVLKDRIRAISSGTLKK
ncbi:MAG TPA: hypothetical protein ENK47_09380 [Euryarchaeota archaeon]|nr:hypothetical protein [Euryarchaeota archaeon]